MDGGGLGDWDWQQYDDALADDGECEPLPCVEGGIASPSVCGAAQRYECSSLHDISSARYRSVHTQCPHLLAEYVLGSGFFPVALSVGGDGGRERAWSPIATVPAPPPVTTLGPLLFLDYQVGNIMGVWAGHAVWTDDARQSYGVYAT